MLDRGTIAVVEDALEAAVIQDVLLYADVEPNERAWAERRSLLELDVSGEVDTSFQATLRLPDGDGRMITLEEVGLELDVTLPSRIPWDVTSVFYPAEPIIAHNRRCGC